MAGFIGTIVSATIWPAPGSIVLIVVATLAAAAISHLFQRPDLPQGARPEKGWPIVGSPQYFTARDDFLKQGKAKSPDGHFSFYYGKYPIVVAYGEEARTAMMTSRGLDLIEAVRALFAPGPNLDAKGGRSLNLYFKNMLRDFSSKSKLDSALPGLVRLVNGRFRSCDISIPTDPFVDFAPLVYSMIHRVVGCYEIAENPKETLSWFTTLATPSAAAIMFPWLPMPSALSKLWATIRMYGRISSIVAERKRTGRREDDALQHYIDNDESNLVIFFCLVGAASVAQANTSMQTAWLPCYLAQDPYWHAKTRDEVDGVVAKYRTSADESPADVLSRLTTEQWETEFPIIYGGIHDSIRLTLPGVSMRRNVSGKDIPLGGSGLVVPPDAFVLYPLEDVHLNPRIYEDPQRWDPSRYARSEQEGKAPHSYLGWGAGLHPCIGTKIAKLMITVTTAMFVSQFDFCLSDEQGNPTTKPLPLPDMNVVHASGPVERVYLKLRVATTSPKLRNPSSPQLWPRQTASQARGISISSRPRSLHGCNHRRPAMSPFWYALRVIQALEDHIVAAILRQPGFHRAVGRVHRAVQERKYGRNPEEPLAPGEATANPDTSNRHQGFFRHFVGELKNQIRGRPTDISDKPRK